MWTLSTMFTYLLTSTPMERERERERVVDACKQQIKQ